MIYADFESIQDNGKIKMQISLIVKNIENMLLAIMATYQYVLMIKFVGLLNHIQVKIIFTILSTV